MKLQIGNYRLGADLPSLVTALKQILPTIATQVNAVSEGRLQGSYNALTGPPSSGLYQAGDFIRNSAPTVQGAAGTQHIVTGWMCIASGEPGVWVQCRSLTGT